MSLENMFVGRFRVCKYQRNEFALQPSCVAAHYIPGDGASVEAWCARSAITGMVFVARFRASQPMRSRQSPMNDRTTNTASLPRSPKIISKKLSPSQQQG